jgi:multiple sugar transport system substrate-binding protein
MKWASFRRVINGLLTIALFLASCRAAEITHTPLAKPTQMAGPTAASTNTALATQMAAPTEKQPQSQAETCTQGIVTVTVHDWSSPDRQEDWDQVIRAFNESHPCILAESVKLIENRDVRLSEIEVGNAPDLVGIDSSDLASVVQVDRLLDLSPLMGADHFIPEDVFYAPVYQMGIIDGKPFALAKDYSVSAFYANINLFEKAGIPLPEEGWTYADYLQIAQRLTVDKNGKNATNPDFDPANVVQWGASAPYWGGDTGWWRGFQSFLYSWGAHTISDDGKTTTGYLNSENAVAAWEWYRDFIHKYHVAPSSINLIAAGVDNETLFAQGKIAIAGSYWGPWYQDVFNTEPGLSWTVIPLPTGPGGHQAAMMWMGWGIHANSEHPEQAWQLLKWLTTGPGQRVFAAKALTGDKAVAAELQKEEHPFWKIFLAEVPFQGRLDDMTTPFYTTCVDIPAGILLGKLLQDSEASMDIKAELDQLAADSDQCLAKAIE